MDLISCNSDDVSNNLADPRITSSETSQKDNLHLEEAMKSDCCEDFMKSMKKVKKIFDQRRCLANTYKIIFSNFSTHNSVNMDIQYKKETHLDI